MLLGLISALALAADAKPDLSRDPDLRCFLVSAYVMGSLRDDAAPTVRTGLVSAITYFFGRIEARYPDADLKRDVARMAERQEFRREMSADLPRCSKEMVEVGGRLTDLGEYIKGVAPLLDSPRS